jgi:hypothetical protein
MGQPHGISAAADGKAQKVSVVRDFFDPGRSAQVGGRLGGVFNVDLGHA